MTLFDMVEELASLVKDNLHSKHLVLSVEEALAKFLESDSRSNVTLALKPMNSYNRLLMHRLADIFGFSHESAGEGEDRHLVLKRCPETAVPPILVSDILWWNDGDGDGDDYEQYSPESPRSELASVVRHNLFSKQIVRSVEEKIVEFLNSDTSSNGTLELEPMSTYSRHLMHRLADIYGFLHKSVGKGEDRHLVLERCAETSIPEVLVSDILQDFDEPQSSPQQLLRRSEEASPVLKIISAPTPNSLEEREAAYMAARERIFSEDPREGKEPVEQKPRSVPVVARRMIAHALGQRIVIPKVEDLSGDSVEKCQADEPNICTSAVKVEPNTQSPGKNASDHITGSSSPGKISASSVVSGRQRNGVDHKKEQLGAAKRLFAQAMGTQSGVSKSNEKSLTWGKGPLVPK